MLSLLQKIIDELLDAGVSITMTKLDGLIHYNLNVNNFKSGITLYSNDIQVIAKMRYNEDYINSIRDVLEIHQNWYFDALERWPTFNIVLEPEWAKLYDQYNFSH